MLIRAFDLGISGEGISILALSKLATFVPSSDVMKSYVYLSLQTDTII